MWRFRIRCWCCAFSRIFCLMEKKMTATTCALSIHDHNFIAHHHRLSFNGNRLVIPEKMSCIFRHISAVYWQLHIKTLARRVPPFWTNYLSLSTITGWRQKCQGVAWFGCWHWWVIRLDVPLKQKTIKIHNLHCIKSGWYNIRIVIRSRKLRIECSWLSLIFVFSHDLQD